jgi:hypothetical protein
MRSLGCTLIVKIPKIHLPRYIKKRLAANLFPGNEPEAMYYLKVEFREYGLTPFSKLSHISRRQTTTLAQRSPERQENPQSSLANTA